MHLKIVERLIHTTDKRNHTVQWRKMLSPLERLNAEKIIFLQQNTIFKLTSVALLVHGFIHTQHTEVDNDTQITNQKTFELLLSSCCYANCTCNHKNKEWILSIFA